MKSILLILIAFSGLASAKKVTVEVSDEVADRPTWHCSVSAFSKTYEAIGFSKTEAKYKAQKECSAANNKMFCDDVECESEGKSDGKGWICTVSAFTNEYEAFGHSKTEAKFKAVKACTAKHDKMHCDDVKCKTDDE